MQNENCQYMYKGRCCPLAGSIRMNHLGEWLCHIHIQSIPVGKEEFVLNWIKDNKEGIVKALRSPLLYDTPTLPLNYSDKRKVIMDELPF